MPGSDSDCLVVGWGTLKVLVQWCTLKHHCLEETVLALMFKKGKDRKGSDSDCLLVGWGTLKVLVQWHTLKHHCLEETVLALMFKTGEDRKGTRQGISVTVG